MAAPEKHEALQSGGVGHCLEIAQIGIERQVLDRPVRQAATATVVSRHGVILLHLEQSRTPNRALPVEFKMVEPRRDLDQRRAAAARGVGNANPVRGPAEMNLRCPGIPPSCAGIHGLAIGLGIVRTRVQIDDMPE